MAMIAVDCTLVYILRLWLVPGITSTRCPGAYFYTLECLLCCWLDALVGLDDLDRLLELGKPEDALAVEPRLRRSKRAKTSDNGTRPNVRYPEDVSDNDMDKFMEALSSVDSQEGLLRKLTELGIDSKIKQCFRKIWLYLRNNPSATFPDWLQSPFNDVMNGFFRDAGKKFDAFEEDNEDIVGNHKISGIVDGVGANKFVVMLVLVLNFEPDTIPGGERLGKQGEKFVLNDYTQMTWAYSHRCHQILVSIFAMVGVQYGIELKLAMKIARTVLVFVNRTPYDGNSRWAKENYDEYQKLCGETDKIMRDHVFAKLPDIFPNLLKLCLFGEHVHLARGSIIEKDTPTDRKVLNDELLCHPERHVRAFSTTEQQEDLVHCFTQIWGEMLHQDPIEIVRTDPAFVEIFTKSRYTGRKKTTDQQLEWRVQWATLFTLPGLLEERLDILRTIKGEDYLSTIEDQARRCLNRKLHIYEERNKAAIEELKEAGYDPTFMTLSLEDQKNSEYPRVKNWIGGLSKRQKKGQLHFGELEMIKDMTSCFQIDFDVEEVEAKKEARKEEVEENAENAMNELF